MTLRHWRVFAAVAGCGSMRKAAEDLYISQPAVSQTIRELEQHYGVLLFDRLAQRIYLTEAGRALLPYAHRALDAFDSLDAFASDRSARHILRVGASVTAGMVILPGLVRQLEAEMPDADVRVTVNNTAFIEREIMESRLDAAIVEGVVKAPELVRRDLCGDELVLVVGRPHPLFGRESVTLDELAQQRLLSRESGSTERNQFDNFLLEHGIEMRRAWTCTNIETLKEAVRLGEGVAILSRMLVEREAAEGEFHILNAEEIRIRRAMKLIYHRDKYFPLVLKHFLELCEEFRKRSEP